MKRENVTVDAIRRLNKLSWDRRVYANCYSSKYGIDLFYLEITYYFNDEAFKYRVDCFDDKDMNQLRAELDDSVYLNEFGFCCSK